LPLDPAPLLDPPLDPLPPDPLLLFDTPLLLAPEPDPLFPPEPVPPEPLPDPLLLLPGCAPSVFVGSPGSAAHATPRAVAAATTAKMGPA
jgi:hypothetical protein